MKSRAPFLYIMALAGGILANTAVLAGGKMYEVTVTNLTRGQSFTPILVASHRPGVPPLFTVGHAASDELAALAEGGATDLLTGVLDDDSAVVEVQTVDGLLEPGLSKTFMVSGAKGARQITLAAMLIPTNDTFFALSGAALPRGRDTVTYQSPGYDAGSEPNDELCVSIPGPVCGGAGGSPGASGEGTVHVQAGIHGIGDLVPADRDWRNPVAQITIRRVR
ncbi:MAG: spondin domain-containing protein [Gammaproteobacteria bacterium]